MTIASEIREEGGKCFLVGGWVRDSLLGHDCRDYDIEVYYLGQETLLQILSRHGKPNLVGKAFGVIHLAMRGLHLDFSFPRTENKVGAGHRGFLVETHPDLTFAAAALRRDFTVNAMGMELPGLELCDPYGGEADLRQGILRHVGPAFVEDSLRVLRGVQFAARFALVAHPDTIAICRELSLDDLSRERIGEEFRKWLTKGNKPSAGIDFFVAVGMPSKFYQVVPYQGDWACHGCLLDHLVPLRDTLDVAHGLRLMLAGLLCGAPQQALAFLQDWMPENDLLRSVPAWIAEACFWREQCRTHSVQDIGASVFRRSALRANGLQGPLGVLEAMLVAEKCSDTFATDLATMAKSLGVWDSAPAPLLTGKDLLGLGLRPGKLLGELIQESFEHQLDGVLADHDAVLHWAAQTLSERGLIST